MKYAIFQKGSKQYKAVEGQEIVLDRIPDAPTDSIDFDQVIMASDEGKVSFGAPFIKGAKVTTTVVGEEKGEKIAVRKYKAKSRYRKAIGHRSKLLRVKVEKIAL